MIKNNIFSILIALVIAYLSLANSENFAVVKITIPNFDKVVHMGMYFVLMSAIIIENRKKIQTGQKMFLVAMLPASYGILMELLQQVLTLNRTGSFFDVVFNVLGILFSIIFFLLFRPAGIKSK